MNIIAYVCTRGRYFTTLPLTLSAIIHQTKKPNMIVIYDDNDPQDRLNLTNEKIYKAFFKIMEAKNIHCEILFGLNKGQHHGHQIINTTFKDSLLWRVDDDVIPEPNVLENLYNKIIVNDKIGAVGGSIITPLFELPLYCSNTSNKIEHILFAHNKQWYMIDKIELVDHLHCSFLYRAGINDYNLNLSNVAHREETIFTYGLTLKGYSNYIVPDAICWHMKSNEGGIRTTAEEEFDKDEELFLDFLKISKKLIVMDNGIGDHIVLSKLIPELKNKYGKLTIACCYPDIFKDFGVELISIEQAKKMVNIDDFNVYKFMTDHNWDKELILAFRELYGI